MKLRNLLLIVGLLSWCAQGSSPAEKWEISFFHDEDRSSLVLNDIKFSSPQRGIAVGFLKEKDKVKPTAVVTSDAGKTWAFVPTKQVGLSLFLLDDSAGWMVTPQGIWYTDEAGRTWKRILKKDGLRSVYFVSREHGFATGAPKLILETKDSGKTWHKLPAADAPASNPLFTVYDWVGFVSPKHGLILGRSKPPRHNEQVPLWMDPEAKKRTEWPTLSIFLQTLDGGASWKPSQASIFGRMVSAISDHGKLMILIDHENYFTYPSEILWISLDDKGYGTLLRRADRLYTDMAKVGGTIYAAGLEPPGHIAHSPVPGKLKVSKSVDGKKWDEIPVDYRAVATNVSIASAGDDVWLATDTGMILKLRRN